MESPTRMRRAQRRAQLLDTATRQFTAEGYHRTSMESIATHAGVTKPVLYQHFSSKEELYTEVVRAVGSRLVGEIDALAHLEGDTHDRIAQGLERFAAIIIDSGPALRMLDASETVSDEVARACRDVVDHAGLAIASVVQRSRVVAERDAAIVGRGLAAMARTLATHLAEAPSPAERERVVKVVTDFVAAGLSIFPPLEHPLIAGEVTGDAAPRAALRA